jgi:sucrose-6-phosphate hydrolase SacC (GH32 family)
MEKLRYYEQTFEDITCSSQDLITNLDGDSYEIKATLSKKEAYRKKFGFNLFSKGDNSGMPIVICPETNSILVNTVEAPFNVSELDDNEDLEIRIFVDKYMVEVFINDRQAVVATYMDYHEHQGLYGYIFKKRERGVEGIYTGEVTFKDIKIWKLKPTNEGFLEAKRNRIWEIDENQGFAGLQ